MVQNYRPGPLTVLKLWPTYLQTLILYTMMSKKVTKLCSGYSLKLDMKCFRAELTEVEIPNDYATLEIEQKEITLENRQNKGRRRHSISFSTIDYRALKDHIKELLDQGHYWEFVRDKVTKGVERNPIAITLK
ncbi:hypothetical protein DVH24_039343 [Malus domestica]|uniref:Uncharacterized protein n=1 Tax=Malus domestica TaxID=3750 RepID=A0A498HZW0_MALDO|nr:hypothetical protein DVH24_039343 [Malus domestica]